MKLVLGANAQSFDLIPNQRPVKDPSNLQTKAFVVLTAKHSSANHAAGECRRERRHLPRLPDSRLN
jgi:hypothetical protein